MENKEQQWPMLDWISQGAFRVENGAITYVNSAAARYLFQTGMQIEELLATGAEEYRQYRGGLLYLSLQLHGHRFGATVVQMDGTDVFILEEQQEDRQFQMLALAAMELRSPLTGVVSAVDRMLPLVAEDASEEVRQYAAQLNQRLMQLQRIVGNMSDCSICTKADSKSMELVELVSTLEEQLSRTAQALGHAGIQLQYQLPNERIFTMVYPQQLERAIYNLISNAVKYSPAGSVIRVQLTRHGERLALSVTDSGCGIWDKGDIFTRYLRQPGIEDSRNGIGLGMVFIRSAAGLHGGAVLVDSPEGVGTRVTMTMAIRQQRGSTVCSPVIRIDYAGERDHCLLELSDVLPKELYSVETIN